MDAAAPSRTSGQISRARSAQKRWLATASRISRYAVKSRCACEWGGWGRLSEAGPGHADPAARALAGARRRARQRLREADPGRRARRAAVRARDAAPHRRTRRLVRNALAAAGLLSRTGRTPEAR